MLLHILQNNTFKIAYYSKFYYHKPFQTPTLNVARVVSTSEVRTAAMLALLMVRENGIQRHDVHTKFHKIRYAYTGVPECYHNAKICK
jgi:hypothetical protein